MMKPTFHARLCLLALSLGTLLPAHAQWLTQSVVVTNGWTAAYLFVDASAENLLPATQYLPISPDNPVDQIWLWKTPASDAQYLNTPSAPLSSGGQWLAWSRTNSQNTLTALIPNAAYLIHSSAPTNYTWRILGQPVAPTYNWDMTGLNFIGFSTASTNPPSFQSFFAQDPAIASAVQIYQYVGGEFSTNPANPAPVLSQYATKVNRGQAYWISATNVYNAYFGPFNVKLPTAGGLSYGSSAGQFTLHLANATPNPLTVSMALLPSETPPYSQSNIVAAPPLLLEGALNSSNLTYGYTRIPANGASSASWTLAPYGQSGSDVAVVLGVNRFAMTNGAGSIYAGILQFTDSLGVSQVNVPVSATAANNAGLWVGSATVTGVSYDLKSYATNSDGSLVISAVTNQVVTTNLLAVGTTTNLLINNYFITNETVSYFQITNQVVNTYTVEGYQPATNSYVLTTNEWVSFAALTYLDTETDVTGYYFTNNGALLVWETTNVTSGPFILSSATTTNQMVVTNSLANVPTNGTLVTATNWVVFSYAYTNELVTNGLFSGPVTNFALNNYTETNPVTITNAAYNVIGSNLVTTAVLSSTNWLFTTNPVAGGILLLTNSTGGASVLSGGSVPSLAPGGTYYLGVQNTNPGPVTYALAVNFHPVTNAPATGIKLAVLATNGGLRLTWFAPSNDLFQVQWSGNPAAAWQAFPNASSVGFDTNYPASNTNAEFTFFDNGSQTGGILPSQRFYRLSEPGLLGSLAGGLPQTNTVAAGGTAYYAVPVPGAADMATNLLLFAGAPVNLLFSTTPPGVTNAVTFSSSSLPVATSYVLTNGPTVSSASTTNYFPVPKPLFVFTNNAQYISINAVTNVYSGTTWVYDYYTTNFQVISNNYVVFQGATNWSSASTNLVAAGTSQSSTLTTNWGADITLAVVTNAQFLVVTNPLVSSVSNYVVTAHNTSLDSVAAPYPLRLIVFNDSSGNCSLLQRVYYGLRQDTNIVVATTESVLDVSHLNVARRISATHLPWTPTNTLWHLAGPLAQGGTLTTTVTEPYDDQAANPFLHTYHPDHNNLDSQSPPHELPVGSESYNITRQISLSVAANTNDFLSLTTANASLTGIYNETILLTGLGGATKSYQTSGGFAIKRVSPISILTTR